MVGRSGSCPATRAHGVSGSGLFSSDGDSGDNDGVIVSGEAPGVGADFCLWVTLMELTEPVGDKLVTEVEAER